jgi:PncC family amidohydrolase
LTHVAGSSEYFQGGVVSYSNRAKMDLLRVSAKTLDAHGAVSAETAREMAAGVRSALHGDLGLAVTGIAGPDGGSRDKAGGNGPYRPIGRKRNLYGKIPLLGKQETD